MIYARLIGIDCYGSNPLSGCANDVENMRSFLESLGPSVTILPPLVNSDANAQALRKALREDIGRVHDGNQLFMHFSGHGDQVFLDDGLDPHAVICPIDYDPEDSGSGISDVTLACALQSLDENARVTITVDACFAGGLSNEWIETLPGGRHRVRVRAFRPLRRVEPAPPSGLDAQLGDLNLVVLAAGRFSDKSGEKPFPHGAPPATEVQGVFTYFLIQTLQGNPRQSACAARDSVRIATTDFPQKAVLRGRTASYTNPLLQI